MKNVYKSLVRKSERKKPFGRPTCRWEDIRIDITEVG
jgi:hypothetical protein